MERARLLRLLMIVSIACSLGAAGSEAIGAVRDRDETIQSGGVPRTYHLHVPPSVPSTAAMPLVMVFHGGGGTGAGAARSYGFNRVADDRGSPSCILKGATAAGMTDGARPGSPG